MSRSTSRQSLHTPLHPSPLGSASSPAADSSVADSSAKSRTNTPSRLCGDLQAFPIWLRQFDARIVHNQQPFFLLHEEYDRSILNASLLPALAARLSPYIEDLRQMFDFITTSDGAHHDPYNICRNAEAICTTYRQFQRSAVYNEANLRQHVDAIINLVFVTHDETMEFIREAPVQLPLISPDLRNSLHLAAKSTVVMDTAIVHDVEIALGDQLTEVDRLLLEDSTHLINRSSRAEGVYIVELINEYKKDNEIVVHNQVVMDLLVALLHRSSVGLRQRPVYGLAITKDNVTVYKGIWEGSKPTLIKYPKPWPLESLQDWTKFNIFLMKLRNIIRLDELQSIAGDVLRAAGNWRVTEKRQRPSSPSSSNKKPKTAPKGDDAGGLAPGMSGTVEGHQDKCNSPSSVASSDRVPTPEDTASQDAVAGLRAPHPVHPKHHVVASLKEAVHV